MNKSVNLESAVKPIGPYSHAVIANEFIFISGQGPVDPQTGEKAVGIRDQVRQTLKNIQSILEGVGSDMEHVVKLYAYLADLNNFDDYNAIYKEFFSEDFPARTTIGAQLLDILVEIDCIAVFPE